MSRPSTAESVKLVASVFYADSGLLKGVLEELSGEYGNVDFISREMPFDYTEYYAKEMGSSLKRRFVFFEKPVRPESLPDIKNFTNCVEDGYAISGLRRVNIDPGYVSKAHLILATGKGYTHRPYLRDGIYADVTLIYTDGSFHPLPWTYPDYAERRVMDLFKKIRAKYVEQLRNPAYLRSDGSIKR
jgi:hypothetical protein